MDSNKSIARGLIGRFHCFKRNFKPPERIARYLGSSILGMSYGGMPTLKKEDNDIMAMRRLTRKTLSIVNRHRVTHSIMNKTIVIDHISIAKPSKGRAFAQISGEVLSKRRMLDWHWDTGKSKHVPSSFHLLVRFSTASLWA